MIGNEANEIIENSLLQRYQNRLENKMRESELPLDSVNLLYYKLHKISLNRGRSYIDCPEWLKNKNAAIYPKNNDDK